MTGKGWSECLEEQLHFSQINFCLVPQTATKIITWLWQQGNFGFQDKASVLGCDHLQCKITGCHVIPGCAVHRRKWISPLAALARAKRGECGFVTLRASVTLHPAIRVWRGKLGMLWMEISQLSQLPQRNSHHVLQAGSSIKANPFRSQQRGKAAEQGPGCSLGVAEAGQNWGQPLAPCPCQPPITIPGLVSLWGH